MILAFEVVEKSRDFKKIIHPEGLSRISSCKTIFFKAHCWHVLKSEYFNALEFENIGKFKAFEIL